MTSRVAAYALSVRMTAPRDARTPRSRQVLLEQRPANISVMPGMWELPTLIGNDVPPAQVRMTLRHAIMRVNYYVRIRTVLESDVEAMTVKTGERRWVPLREASAMALTGLARKVLTRAHLLPSASFHAIAPRARKDGV